ncbi:hypothetical protein B7494_g23 [Chlorociboria aeruginascens]|nr:hypothetical protein B7494_g23 [Chlorociboria aeruginascens]
MNPRANATCNNPQYMSGVSEADRLRINAFDRGPRGKPDGTETIYMNGWEVCTKFLPERDDRTGWLVGNGLLEVVVLVYKASRARRLRSGRAAFPFQHRLDDLAMTPFSYIRSIYALDTLDTRFTSSSAAPYKTVVEARSDSKALASASRRDDSIPGVGVKTDTTGRPIAQASKWRTSEFYLYYFIFAITVPYMFWVAYDVSRPSDPNYKKYEHLLSPGWVPGRKIDVSDDQYSNFRENIPYLAILLVFHPTLRSIYETLRPIPSRAGSPKTNDNSYTSVADGEERLEQRVSFDFGFALIFLAALHGFSALKIVLILYTNFCVATRLPRKYVPAATWIFNIGTLFANELSDGYKMTKIAGYLSPLAVDGLGQGEISHTWAEWIDNYGGIMSRWEILFNITVLRLISFNLDYYWSLDSRGGSPIQLDSANLSERDRVKIPANAKDYNFRNYVGYTIYAPLYLTGPIITFNDYISQCKYAPASIERSRTIKYGIRFLLCLLTMELVLHFDYCVAISKGDPNWSDYTPAQLSLLSYFNLHVLWLKLLLPWRFFRLWALIDGIDPPENMLRCLSNNPSTVAFWRGWHKSYNRWLIRYIYVPLGGVSRKNWVSIVRSVVNYVAVFTFVALWHDISLNLLIWGWLIVFFMLPEVIAGYIFPRKKWLNNLTGHRILCGIGAVGNLMMMMMANLVGFAVGVDGLKSIIYGIFKDSSGSIPAPILLIGTNIDITTGLVFLVTASSALGLAFTMFSSVKIFAFTLLALCLVHAKAILSGENESRSILKSAAIDQDAAPIGVVLETPTDGIVKISLDPFCGVGWHSMQPKDLRTVPVDTCMTTPGMSLAIYQAAVCADGTRAKWARFTNSRCSHGESKFEGELVDLEDLGVGTCMSSLDPRNQNISSVAFWCKGFESKKVVEDSKPKSNASRAVIHVYDEGTCTGRSGPPRTVKADTCWMLYGNSLTIDVPAICANGTRALWTTYTNHSCIAESANVTTKELADSDLQTCLDTTKIGSMLFRCEGISSTPSDGFQIGDFMTPGFLVLFLLLCILFLFQSCTFIVSLGILESETHIKNGLLMAEN